LEKGGKIEVIAAMFFSQQARSKKSFELQSRNKSACVVNDKKRGVGTGKGDKQGRRGGRLREKPVGKKEKVKNSQVRHRQRGKGIGGGHQG